MKGKPFALIGVNSDPLANALAAVEKHELNWRSFQNEMEGVEGSISQTWMVSGWPTIIILDAEGKIQYRGHDGHEATDIAKGLVKELMKDSSME